MLLALATIVVIAGPAWAHTELVETTPADGASVKPGRDTVALTFTRAVDARLAIVDVRRGARTVSEVRPQADGLSLVQAVEGMAPGPYEVEWRAAAADGHILTGTFAFSVADAGAEAADGTTDAGAAPAKRLTPAELLRQHAKGDYDHDAIPSYAAAAGDSAPDTASEPSSRAPAPIAAVPPAGDSSAATTFVLLSAAVAVTAVTAAVESLRRV